MDNIKAEPEIATSNQVLLQEEESQASCLQLFRFAETSDWVLMAIGTISAIGAGCLTPLFTIFWGNVLDSLGTTSAQTLVRPILFNFLELAAAALVANWLMVSCWMVAGERQSIKCRKLYMAAIMAQEVGWFDSSKVSQLATKVSQESLVLQKAISEKVPTFVAMITTTLTGLVIAYVYGWKLSLVITSAVPLLSLAAYLFTYTVQNTAKYNSKNYTKAGGKAEESFNAIKVIKSLCGEEHELASYLSLVREACARSIKHGLISGAIIGLLSFISFLSYALGFWYGGKLISDFDLTSKDGLYTGGEVLVIFFSIVIGGQNIGNCTPSLESFAEGRVAVSRISQVLNRRSKESCKTDALRGEALRGDFQLKGVNFSYPSRPQVRILDGLNIKIQENKRNALVGESGSGKSTVMQLLLRFYLQDQGELTLGGESLDRYDLKWLRRNLGYVGQEPVLFATSIRENIRYGKEDASDEEIWEALRKAEAADFVNSLQQGLDTYIGVGGGQFSGGQKQRLAIARALVKNPRVLLLDQATSALDRKNQKLIQSTLEKVSYGRTTITIAHRLSTVRNADNIMVMEKGRCIEQGNFDSLMALRGKFFALAQNQMQNEDQSKVVKAEHEEERLEQQLLDSDKKEAEQGEKKELQKYEQEVFSRLFGYNRREAPFLALSFLCAMGAGMLYPSFSLFLSKLIAELVAKPISMDKINTIAGYFVLLAVGSFLVNFGQHSLFIYVSEKMTIRLRTQVFDKLIRMPVPFYESESNSGGSLSARLSEDCGKVNKLTSTYIAFQLQAAAGLITGIVISMVWCWQLSCVALGMIPLMIMAGVARTKLISGFSSKISDLYKDSSVLVMEVVNGIRTVKSFAQEEMVQRLYESKLEQNQQLVTQRAVLSGLMMGVGQFITFTIFGLVFYIGAVFISDGVIKNDLNSAGKVETSAIEKMFVSLFAILFAAIGVGNNSHFLPDLAEGKFSASRLFKVIDQPDQFSGEQGGPVDYENMTDFSEAAEGYLSQSGLGLSRLSANDISIQFKDVWFKYPSRKNWVYEGVSFRINPGEKVALVGPSGCGKSSVIQLILRFYDIQQGEILVAGKNVRQYSNHQLRALFGLVSQEPTLFSGTIEDNIVYNCVVQDFDEVREAASKANALTFIESGQDGFKREVGSKGSLLSGGQKQRIAISRVILRKPKFYLFDQATSALDNQSQRLVQEALNRQIKDHASITIAHRLQTIKGSSRIFVFEEGKIVEEGRFQALLAQKGYFYRLYNAS